MQRRTLLTTTGLSVLTGLTGCLGDGQSADDSTDSAPVSDARCDGPAYVLSDDNSAERFDYAGWELWDGIGTDAAGMSRGIHEDSPTLTWRDGDRLARNDEIVTVEIADETLVFRDEAGQQRESYEEGETFSYRYDSWEVVSVDGEAAKLEPEALLPSLKMGWEDGEYLNLDGNIYVVDIEPEERVFLCPFAERED